MAKDYSRIVTKITSTPWMITPDALKMILEIFDAHLSGRIDTEQIKQQFPRRQGMFFDFDDEEQSIVSRVGSVGVLSLSGPIFPKANLLTHMSGATSLEQFRNEFRNLMSDPSVSSILLDIDSPGGLSDLVDEMATEIHSGRDVKPIYAIANTAANSAAYYLGSQATQMFATPSGQVGSIGTFIVHSDDSKQQEMLGVKETVIKAGRFKAVPLEPLTGESLGHLQDYVNQANDLFVEAVARGRNTSVEDVREHFGEGGVVSPKRALEAGMIDGIVTYDEVLSAMTPKGGGSGIAQMSLTGNGHNVELSPTFNPHVLVFPGRPLNYEAGKEHSEPGTGQGGEPPPRESPTKGDKAIEGGWRRDPPPIAYETEEMIVNRAWMEARATALSVEFDGDTTDEELASLIEARIDEVVVPLNAVTAEAQRQRDFAQDYPEQAAEYERLLHESRANAARMFSEEYARFEGSSRGYSTLVRGKIEEAHHKIASRQFTHDDLKELLDLTASKEAIVEWGESGSSRSPEDSVVAPTHNFREDRKRFAELVKTAMVDDNLSRDAALAHVSQQHPELARSYLEGHVTK